MTTPATPAAVTSVANETPDNSYLYRYMCQRMRIELGSDSLANAIRKVEAVHAAAELATAREATLAQQHALELLSLNGQAMERESALVAERDALLKHADDLTHKVICCGVAASHSDPELTTKGAYASKWDSAQAEDVRKLRRERDALRAALVADAEFAKALIGHEEYCERAYAEGWDNDPTGSSHLASSAYRVSAMRIKAEEMKAAALALAAPAVEVK